MESVIHERKILTSLNEYSSETLPDIKVNQSQNTPIEAQGERSI
jgi:hypothetical protein